MYSITVNGIKFNLTSPTQKELDKIPKEELTKIGARIRHLRENSNLTQADMAHILNRTSQAYGNIEAGNVKCLIADDIEIICKKLNTTYHYLIGYTSDPAYGSTYTYCIQNNDKCNKELTNSSETMCYMCEKNINRKNCFMREIDTYTNEVIVKQNDKVIFREDINSGRRSIAEYIESCSGDVIVLTNGSHILIEDKREIYYKIRHLHGNISVVNNQKVELFKDIDISREKLIKLLSELNDFVNMTVIKQNRPIEYTVFLTDKDTINLRDERNLGNMIRKAEFQGDETDRDEFFKALNKITFNNEYHTKDGLFILDEFIRAMDVPQPRFDKLKIEISKLIDKYIKDKSI